MAIIDVLIFNVTYIFEFKTNIVFEGASVPTNLIQSQTLHLSWKTKYMTDKIVLNMPHSSPKKIK